MTKKEERARDAFMPPNPRFFILLGVIVVLGVYGGIFSPGQLSFTSVANTVLAQTKTLQQPTMASVRCNTAGTSATLSWGPVSGTNVRYAPRYSGSGLSSCPAGWYSATPGECDLDDTRATSVTVLTTPGTIYKWWVHAKYAGTWAGISPFTQVSFSCGTSIPNNNAPIGFFDSTDGGVLSGWTFDPDASSQSINASIYMDGPKGVGQNVATVSANILRTDVNDDRRVTGNHGFAWTIPSQYTGMHTWYIYGVDISNPSQQTHLANSPRSYVQAPLPQPEMIPYACSADNTSVTLSWKSVTGADTYALRIDDSTNNTSSCLDGWYCTNSQDYLNDAYANLSITKTITPGRQYSWWVHAKKANTWNGLSGMTKVNFSCGTNVNSPIGFFDSTANGVLTGWALDPDASSRSIDVAIYMDGPKGVGQNVATVNANSIRTDVNDRLHVPGNHGFAWTIPSQYTGTHTWYIYGVEMSDPRNLTMLSGNPQTYTPPTLPVVGPYGKSKFGIVYELWHCDGIYSGYLWDISKALVGDQPWGGIPNFMWWTEPAAGYYCYENTTPGYWENVIRSHAETLKAAGIDFIILDISNWARTDKFDSRRAIMDPLQRLLPIWNSVEGAPKIVQWTPLTSGTDDMFDWVQTELNKYPNLQFIYEGKPLAIAVSIGDGNSFPVDRDKYNTYSQSYTMREMWAMKALNTGMPADAWSIFEPCQGQFLASNGTWPCNQGVTYRNGAVEQVAVATSYQISYATNVVDDVPKFQGRTFVQQFRTALDNYTAPIIIIDAWNEWIGQRMCLPQPGQPYVTNCTPQGDHWPNGMKVFVDSYDYERSRDIEPSKKAPYDFYYQLMKTCITKFKLGQMCAVTDVPYHAPPAVATSPSVPQGWLERADCSLIGGWAQDPDVPTQSIEVSIYADSQPIARVPANGSRDDLCSGLGSCNHAFGYAVPAVLKNGAPHIIQVYGRDSANGSLTELTNYTKTIQCSG